jgi:hypothetical protein
MADLTPEDHELLKGMIAEVMKGEQAPAETPVQAPAPTKIKLPIAGQEMEFESMEDLAAKMTEVVKIAQAHVAAPAPKKVEANVTGDEPTGFNYDKYVELMSNGKVVDGIGSVVRELPEFKEAINAARSANTELAALKFQTKHPELSNLAPQVLQGVAGAIQKTQAKYNLSNTADGLEAAYYLAQRENLIPDFKAAATPPPAPVPVPQNVPQNPYLDAYGNIAAPPVVNRGGDNSASYATLEDMENMSIEQLERLMARMQR